MDKVKAFDVAAGQPWAITEAGLEQLLAIANREGSLEALSAKAGTPHRFSRTTEIRNGVAVIPVTGTIFRHANLFSSISGATSTDVLATDFRAALDDPSVTAIVLNINSPGGAVAGINELAEMVFAARGQKKIVAYGGSEIASAAYWLASAADEIVVDKTAVGGSIGVRMTLTDKTGAESKAGIKTVSIVSSQSPDKDLDVNQDVGRAKIQKIVDDLAQVFVESVARNRNIDTATVLRDFGVGGVKVGEELVASGMADRIGSLESVIAEQSANYPLTRSYAMTTRTTANKGPITVATTAELHAALLAGHTPEEVSVAHVDITKIKADAKAEGIAEANAANAAAIAAARTEATTAERARVSAIMESAMPGFEKETQAAIQEGATAEATALQCAKLARERGVTVGSLKKDAPAAVVHGGQGGGESAAPAAGKGKWGGVVAKLNAANAKSNGKKTA